MIIAIGNDIIEIARIDAALQRHGDRFLSRVFTDSERGYCLSRVQPGLHLAARFAAKEAAAKALGTGISRGVRWTDIEILREDACAPSLHFHGCAAEIAAEKHVTHAHLSYSHTYQMASAFVVLESR